MFEVSDASTIYAEFKKEPGIIIPYYNADKTQATFTRDGHALNFCRVRYLTAATKRHGFTTKKVSKYGQPKASGTKVYFPRRVPWRAVLDNTEEPIVITEGEAKALVGCIAGFPTMGLGGVANFMSHGALLPELASEKWGERDTYVTFDSDALHNPAILMAEARLVGELHKLGARCFLVRIPQEGDKKVGLDDYVKEHGFAGFMKLLQSSEALGALDAKVLALNARCAWIQQENCVWDLEKKLFIPKDSFINGADFSTLKHMVMGSTQRAAPKEISVAATWLKHQHATRYSEILFRPSEGVTVMSDQGQPALNMWEQYKCEAGDVAPFLELNKYVFKNMPAADRELPLKLMIYKAQNPEIKTPLALVLLGHQGGGKSFWCECIRDAFKPWSFDLSSAGLDSEFGEWLEKSLIVFVDEAKPADMARASDILKGLISRDMQRMNEKFRPARQVKTYAQFLITSNHTEVGSFSEDDRRMIVVACPDKREPEFYAKLRVWKDAGGPKHLMHYMLSYDLKGWTPPTTPPLTAEKHMARMESLTAVQRLAEDMRTADKNTVELWLDSCTRWADDAVLSPNMLVAQAARATKANAANWTIRPFYTPEELALMFPHIIGTLLGSKFARSTPSGQISRELREAGVPYLKCADDERGFKHKGTMRQYLVVFDFKDWERPLTQVEFDRVMNAAPNYKTKSSGRAS